MTGAGAYLAYDVLSSAATAVALPWLWYRGAGDGLAQRLGAVELPAGGFDQAPIWLHAASVGETRAVLPLVEKVRRRAPSVPWIVSNTTTTGRDVARREIAPAVSTLLPFDGFRIVDGVFERARPRALIVVENELWPGMLRAAERVGASIVFVSARMSERALRRYLWAKPLFAAALRRADAICAQSESDADRLRTLGARPDRVHVTGNLKAGRIGDEPAAAPLDLEGRVTLVAASTQPAEEEMVLDACASLWSEHPTLLLVLAPRRPERFDEVAELLDRHGVPYQRRSASETAVRAETQVLLIDSVGELAGFFPGARGAFVGGTVAPIGGHNVLEPATVGVPVCFGPNLNNVRESARALRAAGGGVEVRDADAMRAHWRELLADPGHAATMGERAGSVAAALSGAVAATLDVIEPILGIGP